LFSTTIIVGANLVFALILQWAITGSPLRNRPKFDN